MATAGRTAHRKPTGQRKTTKPPGMRSRAREQARWLFLEAVQKCRPEVLKSLAREPFAAFRRLHAELDLTADITTPLRDWLREWRLPCPPEDDEWCERWALRTMREWQIKLDQGWYGNLKSGGGLRFVSMEHVIFGIGLYERLQFTTIDPRSGDIQRHPLDSWDPRIESKDDALRRIRNAFEEGLTRYFEKVERLFAALPKIGRERDLPLRKYNPTHYDWLARFQVGGEAFEDIATADGATEAAVEVAVRREAKFIDLPLRHLRRTGRPLGAADRVAHDRAPQRRN